MFPYGRAESGKSQGSKLFEVNDWMWRFGRPKARDLNVLEATKLRAEKFKAAAAKRTATRKQNQSIRESAVSFVARLTNSQREESWNPEDE